MIGSIRANSLKSTVLALLLSSATFSGDALATQIGEKSKSTQYHGADEYGYAEPRAKLCDKVRDIGYANDDPRAYSNCQTCSGATGCSGRLEIIGAVWGLYEMTGVIRNQYNNGKREFVASEQYFGDQWDCAYKTLRITYRQCG